MSTPLDVSEPPHLWARLLPDGPLYLALSGQLSPDDLGALLRRPDLAPLTAPGHVSIALLDLSALGAIKQAHAFHLGQFTRRLVDAGCRRLAVATAPLHDDLLSRVLAALSHQAGRDVKLGCFADQSSASHWLFSERASTVVPSQESPDTLFTPLDEPTADSPTRPRSAPPPAPPPPAEPRLPTPPFRASPPSPAITKPSPEPVATSPTLAGASPMPLLLPPSAESARLLLGRPLLPVSSEHIPWLTLALGETPRRFAMLREPESTGESFEQALQEGVRAFDRLDLPLEERRPAGQAFVRSIAPLAAEGIVSARFLRKIQEKLGARTLAVAIPTRGTLMAARATPDNATMMQSLHNMARAQFASGGPLALTPQVFLVDDGRLVTPLPLETPTPAALAARPTPAPELPPTTRTLAARTLAEAHLYMDMRGAEPGARGHRRMRVGDVPVSVFEARCRDDRQPSRFVFRIESPQAPSDSYGGSHPSVLIAPDEFLAHADHLARKIPPSAELSAPEQRRYARARLEAAIACLVEVIKFIPPHTDRVPDASMAMRSRWDKLHLSADRFQRQKLEEAAHAYREQLAQL